MALNLKGAKKIAGDKQSSTFHLGSGHQIKIMHAPLQALHRQQLESMPVEKLADGTPDGPVEAPVQTPDAPPPAQESAPQAAAPEATAADDAPAGASASWGPPADAQANATDVPSQDVAADETPDSTPASSTMSVPNEASLEGVRNAVMAGAAAEGKIGKQNAADINDALAKMGKMPSVDDIKKSYDARGTQLEKAIESQKIDPQRLWHSKSSGSKLASMVGMILGGAGSALTGHNYAIENLNKQVNDDIDAQKNEQSKKFSLWNMNRSNMQSDMQANAATRNQLLTTVKMELERNVNQNQDPIARARAAQSIMGINQMIEAGHQYLAASSGQGQDSEGAFDARMNYLKMINPAYHKDLEAKYIPGIGVGKVPVSEKDREALAAYNTLNGAIEDAKHFQQNDAGVLGTFPGSANNGVAESKRQAIVLELNKLHGLNRLNDTEYNSYMESVGSPGAFWTNRSVQKLNEVQNQVQRSQHSLTNSLGIIPFRQSPQDQQALNWARANPNDRRSAAILQRLQAKQGGPR